MMPGGKYAAADLDKAGGTPLVAKRMLEGGYLNGDQISPSGQTLAAEAAVAVETPGQDVVRTLDNPINESRRTDHPQGQHRAGWRRDQALRV